MTGKNQQFLNSPSGPHVIQFKINAETKCESSDSVIGRVPWQPVFLSIHRKQYLNQEVVSRIAQD
jgi:hypothetical protein